MWNAITEFFTKTIEMRLWVVCFIDAVLLLNIVMTAIRIHQNKRR